MKKTTSVLLLIAVLSPIIYFGFIKYAFWQTVTISGYGTFKVPQDWIVTQRGNSVYFTDKSIEEDEYMLYLIGARNYEFSEAGCIETGRTKKIFSNSADYATIKLNANGKIEEKYVLNFYNLDGWFHLLVCDNSIDEMIIIKIAKSYRLKAGGS